MDVDWETLYHRVDDLLKRQAERHERDIAELQRQLHATDTLLLLDWSLEDALREHPSGEIGASARAVYARHPDEPATLIARRAGII